LKAIVFSFNFISIPIKINPKRDWK